LVLRVQVILRRVKRGKQPVEEKQYSAQLVFPGLIIDPLIRCVSIDDKPVELTVKEFDLLHLMAKRPRQVFSRMQLLDLIWDSHYEGDASAVTVLVSRLREKIEKNPSEPKWVKTVWGIGYRFEPDSGESL
jgi:two-component system response regulator ResD